jgi:hypothetical protein
MTSVRRGEEHAAVPHDTWQATDWPPGLRINANGVILGKVAKRSRGTYHPTIQVQDVSGAATMKSLTLVVVPCPAFEERAPWLPPTSGGVWSLFTATLL